jgi:hypothetical protein
MLLCQGSKARGVDQAVEKVDVHLVPKLPA